MSARHATREAWLMEATEQIGEVLAEISGPEVEVPRVRVSVGFPGGRSTANVIGQCWHKDAAADGHAHIFIHPALDDAPLVLAVLAHELVHAYDENQSGHKGRFAQWAKALGLTGKMTATVAGEDLADGLRALVRDRLGDYPHGALGGGRLVSGKPGGPEGPADGPKGGPSHPKQGTRMLKAECGCDEADPYILRITRKQAERGMPDCGLCHKPMKLEVK